MSKWSEKYNELSARLRWLSIACGLTLVIITAYDSFDFVNHVIRFGPLSQAIQVVRIEDLFPTLILCFILIRIYGLYTPSASSMKVASAAWIGILFFLVARFVIHFIDIQHSSQPDCVPDGQEICFGVYVNVKEPLSTLATLIYVAGGIVRAVTLGIIAMFRHKNSVA